MPTAAVVIIGDEILSGKFADDNGPFLIERLRTLGCDLLRLVTIGDAIPDIADEVRRCAAGHDHVITTGGVGPTHDDRTLEGIAAAFGLPLEERSALVALLDAYGLERTPENLRMASVPEGADLVTSPGSSFPVVRVRNVWIFPGVPRLLQAKFSDVAMHFAGVQVQHDAVYCRDPETRIAGVLQAIQQRFPSVTIGSYPRLDAQRYRVMITLEGRDPEAIPQAMAALRSALDLVDLDDPAG